MTIFSKIHKYFLYTSLFYTIKDKEIRNMFYELSRNEYYKWDMYIFNHLFEFCNIEYKDMEKSYTSIYLLSLPFFMILFIKDEKFLNYLDVWWKTSMQSDLESGSESEYKKEYKYIIDKLHTLYPERFEF